MTTRTIEKHLATLQDLLLGRGQAIQTRNGTAYTVDKIELFKFITAVEDLADIDSTKFVFVAFFDTVTATISFYYWDTTWILFNTVSDQTTIDSILLDITALEAADAALDLRVDALEAVDIVHAADIAALEAADVIHDADIAALEAADIVLDAAIVALGTPMSALIRITGDKTIVAPGQYISWDAAVYQRNMTPWVVGSPTRLTTPVGATSCKITACIPAYTVGDNNNRYAYIRKNGASTYYAGKGSGEHGLKNLHLYNIETAWIDVVGGTDYFEVYIARVAGNTTIYADDGDVGAWVEMLAK